MFYDSSILIVAELKDKFRMRKLSMMGEKLKLIARLCEVDPMGFLSGRRRV